MIKPRLAVGFGTAELVADAADASHLALDGRRCKGSAQGSTCEPYTPAICRLLGPLLGRSPK